MNDSSDDLEDRVSDLFQRVADHLPVAADPAACGETEIRATNEANGSRSATQSRRWLAVPVAAALLLLVGFAAWAMNSSDEPGLTTEEVGNPTPAPTTIDADQVGGGTPRTDSGSEDVSPETTELADAPWPQRRYNLPGGVGTPPLTPAEIADAAVNDTARPDPEVVRPGDLVVLTVDGSLWSGDSQLNRRTDAVSVATEALGQEAANPTLAAEIQFTSVVSLDGRYYAFFMGGQTSATEPLMLVSDDGVAWSVESMRLAEAPIRSFRFTPDSPPRPGASGIADAISDGGGITAGGWATFDGEIRPAVWSSQDGSSWVLEEVGDRRGDTVEFVGRSSSAFGSGPRLAEIGGPQHFTWDVRSRSPEGWQSTSICEQADATTVLTRFAVGSNHNYGYALATDEATQQSLWKTEAGETWNEIRLPEPKEESPWELEVSLQWDPVVHRSWWGPSDEAEGNSPEVWAFDRGRWIGRTLEGRRLVASDVDHFLTITESELIVYDRAHGESRVDPAPTAATPQPDPELGDGGPQADLPTTSDAEPCAVAEPLAVADLDGDDEPEGLHIAETVDGLVLHACSDGAARSIDLEMDLWYLAVTDVEPDGTDELFLGSVEIGDSLGIAVAGLRWIRPEDDKLAASTGDFSRINLGPNSGAGCVDVDSDGVRELVSLHIDREQSAGETVTWNRSVSRAISSTAEDTTTGNFSIGEDDEAIALLSTFSCGDEAVPVIRVPPPQSICTRSSNSEQVDLDGDGLLDTVAGWQSSGTWALEGNDLGAPSVAVCLGSGVTDLSIAGGMGEVFSVEQGPGDQPVVITGGTTATAAFRQPNVVEGGRFVPVRDDGQPQLTLWTGHQGSIGVDAVWGADGCGDIDSDGTEEFIQIEATVDGDLARWERKTWSLEGGDAISRPLETGSAPLPEDFETAGLSALVIRMAERAC